MLDPKDPTLTSSVLEKSIDVSNKICLEGIKATSQSTNNEVYEKIPGMEMVMEVFEEVLIWPSKYPLIFKNSPLRNQAGILLFGVPGVGKTFIVSQISKKFNCRMICVKGPELLAKYIGQSEENVRKLFEK